MSAPANPSNAVDVSRIVLEDVAGASFLVDRRAYVDADIAQLEQQRIFDRCWLYVGHESEVPAPGAFATRNVGGRPVILARGDDGTVRVFANTCMHRGAFVCREAAGTAKAFRCPYHSWVYSNQGELIGVPGQDAYGDCFDRADYALKQHRMDSYRGFVFIAFDEAGAGSLSDYLAEAKEYLDLIADQSEVGMEVVRGTQLHGAKANWKLLIENSVDLYHFRALHKRYVDYMESMGSQAPRERGGFARDLGNGHAANELPPAAARPLAHWTPMFDESLKPQMEATRQHFIDRFGAQRAQRITGMNRALLVFPNLMIIDAIAITIRKIDPVGPGALAVTSWAMAPKDEAPELRALRLSHYLTFLGPGGFATPDDIEIVESCQLGFANRSVDYCNLSRGMNREVPQTTDELPARVFWQRWRELMAAAP
ncbi:aromatic ring-hydroxylating dioxygenase subunit alpha [Lysobacter enzymogenes]|uniref:aromatic ring-hydroxylating oxygenase subunit alpha n=1 Tax=Lysobacter enzymogenes TaxID=69 RepID=UPI0037489B94